MYFVFLDLSFCRFLLIFSFFFSTRLVFLNFFLFCDVDFFKFFKGMTEGCSECLFIPLLTLTKGTPFLRLLNVPIWLFLPRSHRCHLRNRAMEFYLRMMSNRNHVRFLCSHTSSDLFRFILVWTKLFLSHGFVKSSPGFRVTDVRLNLHHKT